jgi:hypothetical protein
MAELFPGILLDIVDDEWLVDKLPHDAIIRSGVSWRQSWTGFIHVGIYGVRVLYPGSSIWYSPRIWQNGTDGSVALYQLGSRRASSSKKFNM